MAIYRLYEDEGCVDGNIIIIGVALLILTIGLFSYSCEFEKTVEREDGCTFIVGSNGVDQFYWSALEIQGRSGNIVFFSEEGVCKDWRENIDEACILDSSCGNERANWKDLEGKIIIKITGSTIRTNRAFYTVENIPKIKGYEKLLGKKIKRVEEGVSHVNLVFADGNYMMIDFSPGKVQEVRKR